MAQDGTNTSMFRLGFRDDRDLTGDGVADRAWCFTVTSADTTAAGSVAACTAGYVVPGEWVHLVGVYDRPAGKVRLFVNGTPQLGGSAAEAGLDGTAWPAAGRFTIGRGWNNVPVDRWVGDIDEVYAEQEVWSPAEIDFHAIQ